MLTSTLTADFRDLNDPMEGTFTYSKDLVNRNELRDILGEKTQYKILSLSETPNNMLMWSYYAEAHKGFVVGVEITDNLADIKPVEYVNNFSLDTNSNDRAKSILTKKLKLWTHEEEQRVFIQYEPYVKVEVKE